MEKIMPICKHCGTETTHIPTHYRLHCQEYKEFITQIEEKLTKEFMIAEYIIAEKSVVDLTRELGLEKGRLIEQKLDEYGIVRRRNYSSTKTVRDKKKQTYRERYGVDHQSQIDTVKEKKKQTYRERYGVEHALQYAEFFEKARQTTRERFGVDYALQTEESRAKQRQTNLERYGVEYLQSRNMQEQSKQTCLEKYGVEYVMQSNDIKARMVATHTDLYGGMLRGSPSIRGQIERTTLKRYGVKNISTITRDKAKATCVRRYGVEFAMQNPTIYEQQRKSAFRRKLFVFPSGHKEYLHGYEPMVILDLLKAGIPEEEIITSARKMPKITYQTSDGKTHRYYPDIYLPRYNMFIEVKSIYTYRANKDINLLKRKACIDAGFRFNFAIR
jgi:hypothetical protein